MEGITHFFGIQAIVKSTNDTSFIFSFINGNNLQSANIGYCKNSKQAVYCSEYYGPTLGNSDLRCNNDGTWIGYPNFSYPKVDDIQNQSNFNVDDYEVFQVVKM